MDFLSAPPLSVYKQKRPAQRYCRPAGLHSSGVDPANTHNYRLLTQTRRGRIASDQVIVI